MLNYLRAEIYRVLHKKSLFIYFGIIALLYIGFAFMRLSDADDHSVASDASQFFFLLPAVIGGYLFAALFNDDLNSKNLTTLIGFGMSKAKIVLSKLVLTLLFGAVIFGIAPLFMDAVYAIFGHPASAQAMSAAYTEALVKLLAMFAYTAISAIVVYGLQRPTFAIVVYLLLSLGVVSQLLGLILSWDMIASLLPGLSEHLITGITTKIQLGLLVDSPIVMPIVEYGIYIMAATVLSVVAFNKKELEF
ncbi:hypothetical protein FACS189431_8520 [Alphaproteobacteria bacterium]|nr:hypothetical protein FACS189431_8520 [Alphaproteobacteria bacterium]